MITITDDSLQSLPWITQTGTSVNPVPADAFIASSLPSGALKVTNASSKAYGGALVTVKRQPWPGMAYLGLDLSVYVPAWELCNLARLELDGKFCLAGAPNSTTPIANVANLSSQVNLSTGQFQIDGNPPGWLDTGFKPTLTADKWMAVSFHYHVDWTGKTFSFLSVDWDGVHFDIPAAMQNVPFQVTNWQPVAAVQLQTEVLNPGSCTCLYDKIRLTWSDSPIQP